MKQSKFTKWINYYFTQGCRKHYTSGGGGTQIEEHFVRDSGSEMEAWSPSKFWNLDLLNSPETCIFQFIFASPKFSRKATKLHKRGHLAPDFEK